MGWLIGLLVLSAVPWLLHRDEERARPGPDEHAGNVISLTARLHARGAGTQVR